MRIGIMELGDSLVAGGPSLQGTLGDGGLLFLRLTPEGNLNIHDTSGDVLWSPPVGDAQLTSATLTVDGNFAVYSGVFEDRKEVWSTGTAGRGVLEMTFSSEQLALTLMDTDEVVVVWSSSP